MSQFGGNIMASVAQVRANRLNAQKSTGPRTPEGKAVVAQNAVKHGLLARQVVIRGEDPGEFELFRDRMVQDLDPVGSLESLLAERAAHLGWRLRRAERLDRAAWATLETEHGARTTDKPAAGDDPDEREAVLARGVVADFGRAKLLDRLLGYERRIENSLYRTVGELQKCKKWHERGAAQAGADMDATAGVVIGAGREGERFFAPTKSQDELRSSEELGRGRPSYEEASDDTTTNGAGLEGTSCETKPIEATSDKWQVTSQEGLEPCPPELATSNVALQTADTSGQTNPSCAGGSEDRETCTETQEVGRGRPRYGEASDDATTNAASVDPPASNLTLETSNSAAGHSCQTKPNEVSSGKCQVSSEQSQSENPSSPPTESLTLQTADTECHVTSQPG
jgi:hypothetical protein